MAKYGPKKATLDDYKQLGADMRLVKYILCMAHVEASRILPQRIVNTLDPAKIRIDRFCSNAEDEMFAKFPDISDEHTAVFYGSPKTEREHQLEKEMVALMHKRIDEMFGLNDFWETDVFFTLWLRINNSDLPWRDALNELDYKQRAELVQRCMDAIQSKMAELNNMPD